MIYNISDITPVGRRGRTLVWSEHDAAVFMSLYSRYTYQELSEAFGVSIEALRYKAAKLGLGRKRQAPLPSLVDEVKRLYTDFSLREIKAILGISDWMLRRIIRENSLSKSKEKMKAIQSRLRTELVKKERRNINWGFKQRSAVKVYRDQSAIDMRYRLRKAGYYVGRGERTVYYNSLTRRSMRLEKSAVRMGFVFKIADDIL